jgi:hypothetical protein
MVGFSYYHVYYSSDDKTYHKAGGHYVFLHRLRAILIRLIWRKKSFVHELQAEPWGPTFIGKMSVAEQDKSMSPELLANSLKLAQKVGLYPIDLWGGEWWYWRSQHCDDSPVQRVLNTLT